MKYFLHDSNAFNDEKITELYMQFGYEGIGLFFTILEKMAAQEKPIKTVVLKKQLNVGKKLEKCWKFMEDIGLISSSDGETFNKQLLNFSKKYSIQKENTRKRVENFRSRQAENQEVVNNGNALQKSYKRVSNASKVKESKVKESKDNDISIDAFASKPKSNHSLFIEIFSDWYMDKFNTKYLFQSGKDGNATKQLLAKITAKIKEGAQECNDENITGGFHAFLNSITDKWVLENASIALINSKFNELFKHAKGRTLSENPEYSAYFDFIRQREQTGATGSVKVS